jgi:N-acetylneuraminic acid mutarotase
MHARTFVLRNGDSDWVERTSVPGGVGRLAATAASVGDLAYVFGGYSVEEDDTEVSTPWAHSFDPETGVFREMRPMPGTSLFGHAGGIVGNHIVYCDGVAVVRLQRTRACPATEWLPQELLR